MLTGKDGDEVRQKTARTVEQRCHTVAPRSDEPKVHKRSRKSLYPTDTAAALTPRAGLIHEKVGATRI